MKTLAEVLWKDNAVGLKKIDEGDDDELDITTEWMQYNCLVICCHSPPPCNPCFVYPKCR